MVAAIKIRQPGGPEVLTLEDAPVAAPAPGEVLIRQTAVGVNFVDTYYRTGLYKQPSYPVGIGQEAAGVIEAVGQGVSGFAPGDRVAYCGGPLGAYAAARVIPARFVVRIPDSISDAMAAACMLKGLTAHYLLRLTYKVKAGDTVLIHAAAGGVGLMACQWAKHLGATVIGTVGSDEKAALAATHGCDYPVVYTREHFVEKVKEITGGQGVEVVYDSVGKTTFMDSLDCLKRFGMMVSFGNASGPVPPVEPLLLTQKGSLYLTRPSLMHHLEDEAGYRAHAAELFDLIGRGIIKVTVGAAYSLSEARQAHIDLESRRTTGALILTV